MKLLLRTVSLLLLVAAALLGSRPQTVVYGSHVGAVVSKVPCPATVMPTSVTVTQKGPNKYPYLPTVPHGRITTSTKPAVDKLYSVVCALKLIHYSHPVVQNCPNAWSIFNDQLTFYRIKVRILALHVKLIGCETLSVDRQSNLGTAYPTTKFWNRLRAVIKASQQPPAGDVTITAPPGSIQPVKVTLGRYLKLIIRAVATPNGLGPSWLVHTDPKFLKLVSSGPDGSNYSYRWQAIATGQTEVVLDPLCLPRGCMAPSLGIQVLISS